jgi:hypothetical protein
MDKELLNCLTQKHIDDIKRWLGLNDRNKGQFCPFNRYKELDDLILDLILDSESFYVCDICRIMFELPKIHLCPCQEFPLFHVVKVAKQTIQEWEIKQVINRL